MFKQRIDFLFSGGSIKGNALSGNQQREEFITSWRPQTTFGYKDDFDMSKHKRATRKRASLAHSTNRNHLFRYDSYPQLIIRFNKIIFSVPTNSFRAFRKKKAATGVKLEPIKNKKKKHQNNLNLNSKSVLKNKFVKESYIDLKEESDGYKSDFEDMNDEEDIDIARAHSAKSTKKDTDVRHDEVNEQQVCSH